jgi:hypothetical protein
MDSAKERYRAWRKMVMRSAGVVAVATLLVVSLAAWTVGSTRSHTPLSRLLGSPSFETCRWIASDRGRAHDLVLDGVPQKTYWLACPPGAKQPLPLTMAMITFHRQP